jgi:NADPH:quinone reductase-like Zn-dependent oxidoreductase
MKAIYLNKFGKAHEAFEIREVADPIVGEGEVCVKVEVSGLNFADVLGRKGLYPALPAPPVIMGYDVVGVVESVGPEVSESWIGKRVACLTRFGGYAEKVCTAVTGIAELPDSLSSNEGCALATQYVTALYMSDFLQHTKQGERVLVHAAAGGVGTALIQLLKERGCEIFATVGNNEKVNALAKQGITAVNYKSHDYEVEIRKHLGNANLDVTFNSIGGKTFKQDMRLLGAGGRLILFGFSDRTSKWGGKLATLKLVFDMGRLIPLLLLGKSQSVLGVNMLKVADEHPEIIGRLLSQLVQMHSEGKIKPVIGGEYSFAEIAKAHQYLESRKSSGKIILKW